jgi:hypothetical protein
MSMIRLSDILLQMVYISYRKLLIVDLRLILKISQRHIPNTNRLTSVPFPISRILIRVLRSHPQDKRPPVKLVIVD